MAKSCQSAANWRHIALVASTEALVLSDSTSLVFVSSVVRIRMCANAVISTSDARKQMAPVAGCPIAWLLLLGLGLGLSGCRSAADFHNADGVRLFQSGNQAAALQRFQQAVVTNPTNPDAHYNLAATLHRLGNQTGNRETLKQAEAIYNQCLDLNDNHIDCRRGLAVLLVETDRSNSAFDLIKNWASQHPELADPQIELARLYEEFGEVESAKLHLNQAVMVDQRAARAWTALGRIREQAGETEQALANYQRSLALNPNQPLIGTRIASLQRTFTPDINISAPAIPSASANGTRTVTAPLPTRPRY